jgi:hypothetical protein
MIEGERMKCKYWSEEVEEVITLINKLYKTESAGGMLHVVVDDGNLEDEHIEWCIDYCNLPENVDRLDKNLCLHIAYKMLELTYEQRVTAYYLPHRFECKGDCKECAIEREIIGDYWW